MENIKLDDSIKSKFFISIFFVGNMEWICNMCYLLIRENKILKLLVLNGMRWLLKLIELVLFFLEEWFVFLRIFFM